MQVEEVSQANDQLSDGLGVYEILSENNEQNDADETDPAKMYATNAKKFDEPTSVVEELPREINLGTKDNSKNVIISLNLTHSEEEALIEILREYKDTFAWSYEDMPSLDPSLV